MTRIDAQIISENIDKIKFFADGGILEFEARDWKGEFLRWEPVEKTVLIHCLPKMRIPKPKRFISMPEGCFKMDGRKCRHCCQYYRCQNKGKKK